MPSPIGQCLYFASTRFWSSKVVVRLSRKGRVTELYLDEALARVHVCMIETNQALGVSKTPGPKMGRIYFSGAY